MSDIRVKSSQVSSFGSLEGGALRPRPDVGLLLLRVATGGLMLFHGVHKLFHGTAFHQGLLEKAGLPIQLVYGIPVGEVIAPILMIVGLFTRTAAAVLAFTMVMSIYLAFGLEGFGLNQYGGLSRTQSSVHVRCLGLGMHGTRKAQCQQDDRTLGGALKGVNKAAAVPD